MLFLSHGLFFIWPCEVYYFTVCMSPEVDLVDLETTGGVVQRPKRENKTAV